MRFRASDLSKISRKGKPRRVPAAAAAGMKRKSVISGDMCLGNDTSHGGRGDYFAGNRVPSAMLPYSKKWRCHFFDTLAGPGTVWFRAPLRLLCLGSGERAAPPVLVGVDVIRRAEVRFAPQQHVV